MALQNGVRTPKTKADQPASRIDAAEVLEPSHDHQDHERASNQGKPEGERKLDGCSSTLAEAYLVYGAWPKTGS